MRVEPTVASGRSGAENWKAIEAFTPAAGRESFA